MLGTAFRWIDCPEGSYLHYNARCVGVVARGEVTMRWAGREVGGRCASVAQGKRYAERWLAARLRGGGAGRIAMRGRDAKAQVLRQHMAEASKSLKATRL